jgi:hypothetical protein
MEMAAPPPIVVCTSVDKFAKRVGWILQSTKSTQ